MNRSNSSTPTHSITSEDLSEYSPSLGEMLLNEMDQSHNQHNNFNPSDLCQKDDELADMSASSCADDVDLYTQLAQKDHDLMLAAELGKALLEKNDELMRRHEQLGEEYTLKVEVKFYIFFTYFFKKCFHAKINNFKYRNFAFVLVKRISVCTRD